MNAMEEFAGLYCIDTYQSNKEEKKPDWMVNMAFDICYALWIYRNYYNAESTEISYISRTLDSVGFFPGMGITETDILDDDTGEYTLAKWIFEDIEHDEKRRMQAIQAIEYYNNIKE